MKEEEEVSDAYTGEPGRMPGEGLSMPPSFIMGSDGS